MKTYEQEKEIFVSKCIEDIDDYNSESNTWLLNDLDECWKSVKATNQKLNPSTFFREVRLILTNFKGDYCGIDIPEILEKTFAGNGQYSTLQNYIDDVKKCYDNLPETLEFSEANRDLILQSNLKLVISVAKRYQNRGLTLEELISAGNMGLCVAWDKYKPEHNTLRSKLFSIIKESPDEMSKEYIDSIICPYINYGELRESYDKVFSKKRVYTKKELERWVNKNIKQAKFSSVAALWIRAYILQELNTSSRVVKKPKSEIDKDFEKYGRYLKETIVQIDPLSDPDDPVGSMGITLSDDESEDMGIDDDLQRRQFKALLSRLMDGIGPRDRRIVLKAFGIGLPRAMTPKEISDSENIGVVRVTKIIADAIEEMKSNATKDDLEVMMDYINSR